MRDRTVEYVASSAGLAGKAIEGSLGTQLMSEYYERLLFSSLVSLSFDPVSEACSSRFSRGQSRLLA